MIEMVARFLFRKLITLALSRGVAIATNKWSKEVQRISFSWRDHLLVIDLNEVTQRSCSGETVFTLWSGDVREFETEWHDSDKIHPSKGGDK